MLSCGGDDNGKDVPTPKVTINVRTCSISEGSEYIASELKEVIISYNNFTFWKIIYFSITNIIVNFIFE